MKVWGQNILVAVFCFFIFSAMRVFAQSPQPPKNGANKTDETVKRGEILFQERCPLCHFGRRGQQSGRYTGPNLKGVLKDAKPEREADVRRTIREGTPNMPGYEYTLKPAQIDDLIAFLKTYN